MMRTYTGGAADRLLRLFQIALGAVDGELLPLEWPELRAICRDGARLELGRGYCAVIEAGAELPEDEPYRSASERMVSAGRGTSLDYWVSRLSGPSRRRR